MTCRKNNFILQLEQYSYCSFHTVFHILFRSDACVRYLRSKGLFDPVDPKREHIWPLVRHVNAKETLPNSKTIEEILQVLNVGACPKKSKTRGYSTVDFFIQFLKAFDIEVGDYSEKLTTRIKTFAPHDIVLCNPANAQIAFQLEEAGYILDAAIIYVDNVDPKDIGHAIAGITCFDRRYIVDSTDIELLHMNWRNTKLIKDAYEHYDEYTYDVDKVYVFVKPARPITEHYILDKVSLIRSIFEGVPAWAVSIDQTSGKLEYPQVSDDPTYEQFKQHPEYICDVLESLSRMGLDIPELQITKQYHKKYFFIAYKNLVEKLFEIKKRMIRRPQKANKRLMQEALATIQPLPLLRPSSARNGGVNEGWPGLISSDLRVTTQRPTTAYRTTRPASPVVPSQRPTTIYRTARPTSPVVRSQRPTTANRTARPASPVVPSQRPSTAYKTARPESPVVPSQYGLQAEFNRLLRPPRGRQVLNRTQQLSSRA